MRRDPRCAQTEMEEDVLIVTMESRALTIASIVLTAGLIVAQKVPVVIGDARVDKLLIGVPPAVTLPAMVAHSGERASVRFSASRVLHHADPQFAGNARSSRKCEQGFRDSPGANRMSGLPCVYEALPRAGCELSCEASEILQGSRSIPCSLWFLASPKNSPKTEGAYT